MEGLRHRGVEDISNNVFIDASCDEEDDSDNLKDMIEVSETSLVCLLFGGEICANKETMRLRSQNSQIDLDGDSEEMLRLVIQRAV